MDGPPRSTGTHGQSQYLKFKNFLSYNLDFSEKYFFVFSVLILKFFYKYIPIFCIQL